jgi:hypothetical protein
MELTGLFSQDIPEAIAPARPVTMPVGPTIPTTLSTGVQANMDSLGNLWNSAGQYIGNMTAISSGLSPMPTPAPSPSAATSAANTTPSSATPSPSAASSPLATLEKWAAALVDRGTTKGGITLEDMVLIVIGLMLVGAAVFTFKDSQTVIKNVTKTASKAAELAA